MKRFLLAGIIACCTLQLSAQVNIRVNYQGSRPTISDFLSSFAVAHEAAVEEEGCSDEAFNAINYAWDLHKRGLAQDQGDKLTVDERNGYICLESTHMDDGIERTLRWEMCYWNESDGQHKLVAYNVTMFSNGKCDPGQFDGITFYRYNNATKKMTLCDPPGFERAFGTETGEWISYSLPRTGKDIVVTTWYAHGPKHKTLRWNGRIFQ